MKVMTKEEEEQHYAAVVRGGTLGGVVGLGIGLSALYFCQRRYAVIRNLTLPFRTFLITSTTTFGAIVEADRRSIQFAHSRDPNYGYEDQSKRAGDIVAQNRSTYERFMHWGKENRYRIVAGSWVASMAVALAIVNRQKWLSGAQRLVQARVYAQGLTVAVLVVTAIFEMNDAKNGSGRWETIMVVDPNDPEHKHLIEKKIHKEEYEGQDLWKDMVAAEERRIKEREAQKPAARQ